MCIYIHISLSLYIYIERERELTYQIVSRWRRSREAGYGSPRCPSRAGQLAGTELVTPSPLLRVWISEGLTQADS